LKKNMMKHEKGEGPEEVKRMKRLGQKEEEK
jgi:hypothetical protein